MPGHVERIRGGKKAHQTMKAGDLHCSVIPNHSTAAVTAIMVLKKIFALFSWSVENKRASTSSKSNRSSWTLLPEGLRATSERAPSEETEERRPATTPSADNHVRLCPHETLSFKRAQRVLSLYGQGDLYPTMDAFTSAPQLNHSELSGGEFGRRKHPRLCKQDPNGYDVLQATSDYGFERGLILNIRWQLSFEAHPELLKSVESFQQFLDSCDIFLCPHKKLSDAEIVFKAFYSLEPPTDPVEKFEIASMKIKGCDQCGTEFWVSGRDDRKCRVETFRPLGTIESADDKQWLAQCSD